MTSSQKLVWRGLRARRPMRRPDFARDRFPERRRDRSDGAAAAGCGRPVRRPGAAGARPDQNCPSATSVEASVRAGQFSRASQARQQLAPRHASPPGPMVMPSLPWRKSDVIRPSGLTKAARALHLAIHRVELRRLPLARGGAAAARRAASAGRRPSGHSLCSMTSARGATRLAISASPNSRSRPKTLR